MSKVTMPDRVAKIGNTFQLLWFGARTITEIAEQTGAKVGDALITTTQAEAYADAVRREALKEAAEVAMNAPITAGMLYSDSAKAVSFHASSMILGLIKG